MVHPHHAHQRKLLPNRGFQLGDVEQESRVAGEQHDRPAAPLGHRRADRVGQAGSEVTEILIPDHVARLGLRIGPLEDHRGAPVAHHDAVIGELVERLGGLHDEARRMYRRASARRLVGDPRQLRVIRLDQRVEAVGRRTRAVFQGLDELGDDAAQVTHQRDVDPAVDTDGRRVLLDEHPSAIRVVVCPMLGAPVVHGFTEFGTQRDTQIGFLHRLVGGRREQVGKGAVLQTWDERRSARGLDHRAGHQLGQFLDLLLGARGVHTVADQQHGALGRANQLHRLGHLAGARALVHQPVGRGLGCIPDTEFLEDHVRGELHIRRTGGTGHRPANRLVDDLVGLVGVLDGTAVLDRRREQAFLLHELDPAAADPAFGDPGPLPAEEDHRRVLHQRAHHGPGDVGHTRSQGPDAQTGPARHPGGRLGHEPGTELVVRRDHGPATRMRLGEHVHEVRVRNAEQRVHALGLEQVENALVDRYIHRHFLFIGSSSAERASCGALQGNRTENGSERRV